MTTHASHLDQTHDALLSSWITSANDPATDFPIQNLPYCAFEEKGARQLATRAINRQTEGTASRIGPARLEEQTATVHQRIGGDRIGVVEEPRRALRTSLHRKRSVILVGSNHDRDREPG